jgi:A1 cistron-splicing factor AAR2
MSSKLDISQEHAQWLFTEGALLVFLDLPAGSEFGVDYNSWQVGTQFRGVKMIPPGIHFIYYSAVGSDGQVAPRTGFIHDFKQQEVLIKVWDPSTEDVKSDPTTPELQQSIESNKQELDQYLGVYPYDSYKKWVSLTDHITPQLLVHLVPLNGKIYAATPLQSESSTTESRRAAVNNAASVTPVTLRPHHSFSQPTDIDDDPRLPHMDPIPGSQIRFTTVPWNDCTSKSPSDITAHGMDRSTTLGMVIELYSADIGAENGLLGELQFAFVCFIIGQVYEAFEAWKRLVHLLCSCVNAISVRPSLYMQLLAVLHRHIAEIPEDFFVDIITRDNFLTSALRSLFENIDAAGDSAAEVKSRAVRFRKHLERKFRWDFGAETGEFAPVVVDLGEGYGSMD